METTTAALAASFPQPDLARAQRRESRQLLANVTPAMLLVGGALVVPLAWLLSLSFSATGGGWTFANYARLFEDTSYLRAFELTARLALVTTLACAIMGYLLAYAIVQMPRWAVAPALALVALPFWTSVLVRTYAWMVLLQNRGLVNTLLVRSGILESPIPLMHNATGALIGMVHIMLPFMVFPLYAAMLKVDADHVRAAASLGATPVQAFWKVFFPQTLPGIVAGSVLVFVLSLGFYITPALMGGGRTVVMSILIEHEVTASMNWGTSGAMAVLFVAVVACVFALAGRFVSLERLFQR